MKAEAAKLKLPWLCGVFASRYFMTRAAAWIDFQ